MKTEVMSEGAKSTLPVTVSALAWFDAVPLNNWLILVSILYVLMQASYLVWKWYKEYKASK